LVLKTSTGTGKTAIALLHLAHVLAHRTVSPAHMHEGWAALHYVPWTERGIDRRDLEGIAFAIFAATDAVDDIAGGLLLQAAEKGQYFFAKSAADPAPLRTGEDAASPVREQDEMDARLFRGLVEDLLHLLAPTPTGIVESTGVVAKPGPGTGIDEADDGDALLQQALGHQLFLTAIVVDGEDTDDHRQQGTGRRKDPGRDIDEAEVHARLASSG